MKRPQFATKQFSAIIYIYDNDNDNENKFIAKAEQQLHWTYIYIIHK